MCVARVAHDRIKYAKFCHFVVCEMKFPNLDN